MVHILPCLEDRIVSTKSPEDIYSILKSVTVSRKIAFCNSSNAEFIGEINASAFKIVRRIVYKNSFLPVIVGTVKVENGISVIDVKMSLHFFIRIFLAVWFGIIGFFFLLLCLNFLIEGMKEGQMLLGVAMFFILGQALVRAGFYIPAKKAKKRLEELLR